MGICRYSSGKGKEGIVHRFFFIIIPGNSLVYDFSS